MFLTVGVGLFRYLTGTLGHGRQPAAIRRWNGAVLAMTPFLLLHAFSSGTSALTGIEAISNGITAFKEPRSRNAGITLIWMSVILGTLFLGISFLASHIGAVPSEEETVISQLARTILWQPGCPLPGGHRRHDRHPDHGSQHRLRRFSPPERLCTPATASCRASSPSAAAGWSIPAASFPWP